MDNKLQIDLAGIDKVYAESNGLNLPLVKEAVRQTELKIQDEHARKERIDSRAYTLLTVWLSLIGVIFAAITSGYISYPWLLVITAVMLVISAMYLFQALKPRSYASMGIFPHDWLNEGYLKNNETDASDTKDHNEHILALILVRLLHAKESGLQASDNSNNKRLELLNRALLIGQYSFVPVVLNLVLEALNSHPFFRILVD